jgi:amino acid permease
VNSYAQVGYEAFGKFGANLVNVAIISNQVGNSLPFFHLCFVCCVVQIVLFAGVISAYQQFIGTTIPAVYPSVLSVIPLSGWVILWFVVLGQLVSKSSKQNKKTNRCCVLIPLCWVRELKWFSFTSIFGLCSMLFTVIAVIVNGSFNPTPLKPLPLAPSDLFLFLGIAAFGYAGIAISISVENSMAKPYDFLKMISGFFGFVWFGV